NLLFHCGLKKCFSGKPSNLSMFLQKRLFKGHLDEDEELFFVAHKHWMEILERVLILIFLGIIFPWVLWMFLDFKVLFVLLWNLGFLFWFCYHVFDWYFDAFLITDRSVIDVAWYSFFDKESARVDYGDLKEMSYEIRGLWPTILQYGNIFIHLNSGSELSLKNVRNPKNVELVISRYKEEFLTKRKMTDTTVIQEILADIVKNHIAEHGVPQSKENEEDSESEADEK